MKGGPQDRIEDVLIHA